ncbi:hypothetical protein PG996_011807 [Apiospora saccharicola]|uniref:Uncharacterized protein n=1 Tax=Apiospora saccharicola TaxID=335842 RepID=A0ABR1UG39_9PEZI
MTSAKANFWEEDELAEEQPDPIPVRKRYANASHLQPNKQVHEKNFAKYIRLSEEERKQLFEHDHDCRRIAKFFDDEREKFVNDAPVKEKLGEFSDKVAKALTQRRKAIVDQQPDLVDKSTADTIRQVLNQIERKSEPATEREHQHMPGRARRNPFVEDDDEIPPPRVREERTSDQEDLLGTYQSTVQRLLSERQRPIVISDDTESSGFDSSDFDHDEYTEDTSQLLRVRQKGRALGHSTKDNTRHRSQRASSGEDPFGPVTMATQQTIGQQVAKLTENELGTTDTTGQRFAAFESSELVDIDKDVYARWSADQNRRTRVAAIVQNIPNHEFIQPAQLSNERAYVTSDQSHYGIDDNLLVNKARSPKESWHFVLQWHPIKPWFSEESVTKRLVTKIKLYDQISATEIYRQVRSQLKRIDIVLGHKDYKGPEDLKGLTLPHPHDIEIVRINGDTRKGFGVMPNAIDKLLGATGLDFLNCNPATRDVPPLWRATYHLLYETSSDERYNRDICGTMPKIDKVVAQYADGEIDHAGQEVSPLHRVQIPKLQQLCRLYVAGLPPRQKVQLPQVQARRVLQTTGSPSGRKSPTISESKLKSVITDEFLHRNVVDVKYVDNKIALMRASIEQNLAQKLENTIEEKLEPLRQEVQSLRDQVANCATSQDQQGLRQRLDELDKKIEDTATALRNEWAQQQLPVVQQPQQPQQQRVHSASAIISPWAQQQISPQLPAQMAGPLPLPVNLGDPIVRSGTPGASPTNDNLGNPTPPQRKRRRGENRS